VFNDVEGKAVARSGIDLLALKNGRIVEVWSVSSGAAGRTFYPQG
jgi:predicted ester cyclase